MKKRNAYILLTAIISLLLAATVILWIAAPEADSAPIDSSLLWHYVQNYCGYILSFILLLVADFVLILKLIKNG